MDNNYEKEKEATRLAKLEERTSGNTRTIERVIDTLDKVWTRIEESERAIINKIERQQSNRQITWPLIFSAVIAMVSLFGIAVLLFNGAMNPMRVKMESAHTMAAEHYRMGGHVDALVEHARQFEREKWVDKELARQAKGMTEIRLWLIKGARER